MEKGFYHPDRGYWQTTSTPSDEVLESYPAGTVEYPIKPGEHYQIKEGGWEYVEPPPPPEPISVVYAVDLWTRMTDAEANEVGEAMQQQPFRMQNIFRSANSYRSDHELWGLLQQIAVGLFGESRAAEILEPSEQIPAR